MKTLKLNFKRLPLNRSAIYHTCEFLLLTHASIGAEEVQNHLLDDNYEEDIDYVQNIMQEFAEEENWMMTADDRFCFSEDTNETLDTILRKGAKLTKIHVLGKVLTVKDLRRRQQEIKEYNSNRQAMFWAVELIKKQVAEGYYKL